MIIHRANIKKRTNRFFFYIHTRGIHLNALLLRLLLHYVHITDVYIYSIHIIIMGYNNLTALVYIGKQPTDVYYYYYYISSSLRVPYANYYRPPVQCPRHGYSDWQVCEDDDHRII